jgi:hypothetical protein
MKRNAAGYIIGVDLGREVNHSAFAVAAVLGKTIKFVHLERVPLRTGYLQVLAKLRRLIARLRAKRAKRITVVCDAAGPGKVAIELIERRHPTVAITPVTITGGRRPGDSPSGGLTVPREALLTNLASMITKNLVHVTKATPHGQTWIAEASTARTDGCQYQQDDLAIAAALTAWQAGRVENRGP